MELSAIRNFVIISHVDHGKSTLADRFLELTGAVEPRKMRPQYLDRMDLEREKGITIKMQPVRMIYRPSALVSRSLRNLGEDDEIDQRSDSPSEAIDQAKRSYVLNLIDTPGHADFSYEVSRALQAVEGAILLVDATQGIQAQTISNLHLAVGQHLTIIPVVNKIDLAGAGAAAAVAELAAIVGCRPSDVLQVSAKTGSGVPELLGAVIGRIPPPAADRAAPRALIFDSQFDAYRGIIAHVRVFGGGFRQGDAIQTIATATPAEVVEVGYFSPVLVRADALGPGEIGYVATGLKTPDAIRVGDTITGEFKRLNSSSVSDAEPLPGYREPQSVVFASVYPDDADDYERLSEALAKMKLNDAAIVFEPESSDALGRGWRMGFLGALHLDIVRERLSREYDLDLVFATPSVAYRVIRSDGASEMVHSASRLPDESRMREIAEPWARLDIITPSAAIGRVMELLGQTRGTYRERRYLGSDRTAITYEAPLADVIVGFADALKRVTAGYGSFGYELIGYRPGDLVRLDMLIGGEREEALSRIVPRSEAYRIGRGVVERLKTLLPRSLFAVSIQAAAGGRIIARETLPALKKDVTGYLYGGDRTRKMKLWSKQQRGKARLRERGRVRIPADVFSQLMRSSEL